MPIPLGQIHFGQIDAKNEVFQQDRMGINVFRNSFQIPPGIDTDQLIIGSKFFISGQKGCGKTALLLHIKEQLESMGAKTSVLLFKSGISEAERQQIATGSNIELIEQNNAFSAQYDYELNWIWYIYRNLIRMIDEKSVIQGLDTLK
jgi:hypothetical protein